MTKDITNTKILYPRPREVFGLFKIYGEWDDVSDDEILVYTKDLNTVIIFLMHGMDYGGGIDKHFEMPSLLFYEYVHSSSSDGNLKNKLDKYASKKEIK